MSDNIKLIIEIPKEIYKKITADKYAIYDKMYYSIKNGIPLDENKGEWIDDKCSVCGKGIEDLISSCEWYRNEEPNFCPFCGVQIKSEE